MNDILLNIIGCGSIAAMLFSICVMWHNIDKQLSLIEKTSTSEKASIEKNKQKAVNIKNAAKRETKRNTCTCIRTAGHSFRKSPELYYISSKA